MARKRSLDDGPVLRAAIMDASAVLFYERGFGATSIRDIAEAVGISSSTMYHHFTNKQDILHACVARFMGDFVAATVPVLRDPDRSPTDRIREMVRLHLEISDDRRTELLVGNPIRHALNPEQQKEGVALQQAYHDAVRAAIAEGRARGEFATADPEIATMAVLDMLNGVREWYHADGPLSRDEVIDMYTEIVFKILR
ncbi:MAG TPA: TetR/AcrR family transcriptional regulator [Pseudonocardiaceae bacterium]|nr:TetR/AcrR family transcriptional regulator [Pseudonocardiaceae bacterium]